MAYEIYDPVSASWTVLSSPLGDRELGTSLITESTGDALIVGGGTNLIERFNFGMDAFSLVTAMADSLRTTEIFRMGLDSFVVIGDGLESRARFVNGDNFRLTSAGDINYGQTTGFSGEAFQLPDGRVFGFKYGVGYLEIEGQPLAVANSRWEKVWNVTQAQIDQLIVDFATGSLNADDYPDILDWPAHGDVSLGEDANIAPFIDVNNDGRYRPETDGDYPCIQGDQSLFYVFNDDCPHTETGGNPLQIQVKAQAYAYNCATSNCQVPELGQSAFYTFDITNKSGLDYQDVFLGNWVDADIGYFADDYVGSASARNLGFTYNGPPFDSAGYGAAPPAIGAVILDSPDDLVRTLFISYIIDFSVRCNPDNAGQFYQYLNGIW